MSEQFIFSKEFDVRAAGNALLNDYKRLQFENDKLTARIAELEYQLEDWTNNGWAEDYKARIAELEVENDRLQAAWFEDETICPDGSLKPKVSTLLSRIAELEGKFDQLIEIGGWAITGMTIATSYSPGEMQNLAEKKSDDWYALIKNLKECDKEKEREE